MTSTLRLDAAERLRTQLEQYDWSAQSASRRAALAAFLRLANVHGFAAVTMRMLATELHIKAPSLYAHFPNGKDEIVGDSLRWHFSKFGDAILDATATADTAEAFWDALVRTHLSRQLQLPESNLWDLLVATGDDVHFLPADVRRDVDDLVRGYEDLYRFCAADMGIDLPEDLLGLLMALLEGATKWSSADDVDVAVGRALQVSRTLLRLPTPSLTQ